MNTTGDRPVAFARVIWSARVGALETDIIFLLRGGGMAASPHPRNDTSRYRGCPSARRYKLTAPARRILERLFDFGGNIVISTAAMDVWADARCIAHHLSDSDVLLVEVDVSPATYNQAHIPGAILWNAYADLRNADYRPISRSEFE